MGLMAILLVAVVVFPVNGVATQVASTPSPSATHGRAATPSPRATPTPEGAPDATPTPDAVQPVVSSAGFTHPGVFNSLESLETSRKHVVARDKPWITIFQQLVSSPYVAREAPDFSQFTPADATDPLTQRCGLKNSAGCVTYCGSFSAPDVGCTEARLDARAVYAQALMYWYTGDTGYAQRAIAILNAYARHFKGNTGSNGPLMTAWLGETMLRGAEILRYTYVPDGGDEALDVQRFSEMLRTASVPTLSTFDYGPYNGNWKLSAADSLINTAVFLDDRYLYNRALTMWREAVPAYIYVSKDGPLPATPVNAAGLYQHPTDLGCLWLANKVSACRTQPKTDPGAAFQNGQTQESCRDFGHTGLGLGATVNAAETAFIQGDDLYGEEQHRIISGVLYAVQISQTFEEIGWPRGFCGGTTDLYANLSLANLAADVTYNAYAVRQNLTFSKIKIPGYRATYPENDPLAAFIAAKRTTDNPVGDVSAWESLTHHLADKPVLAISYTKQTATPRPSVTLTTSASPSPIESDRGDARADVAIAVTVTVVMTMARAGRALVLRRRRRRP
ncbi:MAG: hypothetical protein K0R99_3574 [Microbacterium sp.]|jgi:hypothetical protein|nr:hypothetical protein [Microbacterium sp.]